MIYGSVCSGIEAASQAWHPLGWSPAFFAEVDRFPSAVLAHHYGSNMPDEPYAGINGVPNYGDMTKFEEWPDHAIDVLVGGTPCQDFSVAGRRAGVDGARGGLTLRYAQIARRYRPRWLVWENVPGVFSLNGGADFGAVLACFAGYPDGAKFEPPAGGWKNCGIVPPAGPECYGLAWRVLDAQYVRVDGYPHAVPQRRRRVFVVGYLGDWRRAAAVLFEPEGLRGDPAPRRKSGERVAPTISARPTGGGGLGTDFDCDGGLIANGYGGGNTSGPLEVSAALTAHGRRQDFEVETFVAETGNTLLAKGNDSHDDTLDTYVAHSLRGEGFNASEDGTGRGTPLVPVAYRTSGNCGAWETGDTTDALTTSTDPNSHVLAFSCKDHGNDAADNVSPTLRSMGHNGSHANAGGQLAVAIQERAVSENLENGPGGKGYQEDLAYTLEARNKEQSVAYDLRGREGGAQFEGPHETANIRAASGGSSKSYVADPMAVRRLTPRECERLQGFPDDYTKIPYRNKERADCPDGPRYKALGNSMAVNVMRWIGARIALVDALETE